MRDSEERKAVLGPYTHLGIPSESVPHSESYIDSEGEERCTTCDKWLEPGYYDIEDHQKAAEDNTCARQR